MPLLQISDPEKTIATPAKRFAAGIDLGTTNTLIAVSDGVDTVTLADERGRSSLPSVARFLQDGTVLVGEEAETGIIEDPSNTFFSVKRLLGRAAGEIKALRSRFPWKLNEKSGNVIRLSTVAGEKTAVDISAAILKAAKERAERYFGGERLAGAVITVPAYFNDAQRQATKDAAKLSEINVLRLLNEPTAAAVAYGLNTKKQGTVLVFDLGGGTFDVSILRLEKGIFRVLATGGDTALGGDDMDRLVAESLLSEAGLEDCGEQKILRTVGRAARAVKESLSSVEETEKEVVFPDGGSAKFHFTRAALNILIEPMLQKTIDICLETISDAGLKVKNIDELILVGGATRMPALRRRVEAALGRKTLAGIDPDRVVAHGAAIQANVLIGNASGHDAPLLLDVIPLSLGLETMGGLTEKLVARNSSIPCSQTQEFTTHSNGQTAISLHVVQGERELANDCRSLARFELRGLPSLAAGQARVRVTFQVDADALLSVVAEEKTLGLKAAIEVKPSYGLSDEEIEKMLRDSFSRAHEDECVRKLSELRMDADRALEALAAAIKESADALLDDVEKRNIFSARKTLEETTKGDDPDKIGAAISGLELASKAFMEKRMNLDISSFLRGKSLETCKSDP